MRYSAVSGTYYPSDKTELKAELDRLLAGAEADEAVKSVKSVGAAVTPHGQLSECGDVMAAAYAPMKGAQLFTTFVILGTDHFGKGTPVAMSREDWRTPFGVVRNDRELGNAIKQESIFAEFDEKAHNFEPACEVQLPFIQAAVGDVSCVEISISSHTYDVAADMANAISKAAESTGRDIILIGSTDFSEGETPSSADSEDSAILDLVRKMDAKETMSTIEGVGSSICGPAVLGATMLYADRIGLRPTVLGRRTIATGKKEGVKSFVSIAFGK
ncbi:Memo-like protein [uncultured archaeon]|nr:Memo-like protein [uncultured archaeon]